MRLGLKGEQEQGGGVGGRFAQFVKLAFPPKINLDPTAKQIQDSQRSKVGQDAVSDHDNSCDNLYSNYCLWAYTSPKGVLGGLINGRAYI